MEDERLYMSIRKISQKYGISVRYLRNLDHCGRLPSFRSGNRTNVNVSLLLAQLEKECEKRGATV